jgi:hypothetical protein
VRGRKLSELRTLLKAECGIAMTSANYADDVALNLMLSSRQHAMSLDFDWPFLEQSWELAVAPGGRYMALPTQTAPINGVSVNAVVNIERPLIVDVLYNNQWLPVEYGIGTDEYNTADPDHGWNVPMDPIRKWRMASNVGEASLTPSMIEVWPQPASGQTLRFSGWRQVYELFPPSAASAYLANSANYAGSLNARDALDAAVADLDDLLLVHTCAAEKLMKLDQKNAQLQMQLARSRLMSLKSTSPASEDAIVFGRSQPTREQKRLMPMILVHG